MSNKEITDTERLDFINRQVYLLKYEEDSGKLYIKTKLTLLKNPRMKFHGESIKEAIDAAMRFQNGN